ncbi:MAG: hypothetical protein HZC02_01330 [Candidatus Levybacteria bacterium]|nr:hypothetical protein [Candidatus Levybacteria bacterium]
MNKVILGSISMDLKRVAMGYFRGSHTTADRFLLEAQRRKDEIDSEKLSPYLQRLFKSLDKLSLENDLDKKAEDALMYSTLFQNAALLKKGV